MSRTWDHPTMVPHGNHGWHFLARKTYVRDNPTALAVLGPGKNIVTEYFEKKLSANEQSSQYWRTAFVCEGDILPSSHILTPLTKQYESSILEELSLNSERRQGYTVAQGGKGYLFIPDHPLWSDEYWALCKSCEAAPGDDLPKLVLADWLDEHGEWAYAERIRVGCCLQLQDGQRLPVEFRQQAIDRYLLEHKESA